MNRRAGGLGVGDHVIGVILAAEAAIVMDVGVQYWAGAERVVGVRVLE